MTAITFDTLKFAKRLKKLGVESSLAEGHAEALSEVLEFNLNEVATKADLQELKSQSCELESRLMGEIKLLKWILALIAGGIAILILKAFS